MEVSMGSADIKRRLRLELNHKLGPIELAQDVRKRLTARRRSTSFVSWRKCKALIKDLNIQVSMVVEKIAPENQNIAFDLLWQFIEIAPSVYGRIDDSKGEIYDLFRAALDHFKEITPCARLDKEVLADLVWDVIKDNDYGEWDGIIALMAHTLGPSGLAQLTANVETYATTLIENGGDDHEAIQFCANCVVMMITQLTAKLVSSNRACKKSQLLQATRKRIVLSTPTLILSATASQLKS
jgi:hypothetical protein